MIKLLLVLPFCMLVLSVSAQQRPVSGIVTSAKDGLPLQGVSVTVRGTKLGVQTQADGSFKLDLPSGDVTLVISSVGFVRREVFVHDKFIQIALEPVNTSLNDVIVIGYGTQKKKDLTGSVAVIAAKDFNQGPTVSPEQLISGKVAGVQITSNGGSPGAGSTIRIRGGASLIASNDPLIVIDGVPVDNGSLMGTANPLSLINPNDIESFNVLKDASATAIYGSRASNGVIIVTTRKGKAADKLKVQLSSMGSLSKLARTIDVLSADNFRKVVNDHANSAQKALLGNANTNWQDAIFQTALSQNSNISVTGAIKNMPFRLSLGYLSQEGILKTDRLKRTTAGINLSPKFFDNYLKVDLNWKGVISKNVFANQGAIPAAVAFDPTQPIYANNIYGGYFQWVDPNTALPNIVAAANPLSLLEQTHNTGTVKRSLGNIQVDYRLHFLPDLRFNVNLGYDVSKGSGRNYSAPLLAPVYIRGGINNRFMQSRQNKLLESYFNYTKDLRQIKSRIDLTAGYSYQDYINEVPAYPDLTVKGDTINPAGIPFKTQNTLVSFFGRGNYTLNNQYLLTVTFRRDGSSRFSRGNRWGTFPSAALAWKMKEASFLRSAKTISDLKLRLGYGVTGQQDLGAIAGTMADYPYIARYTLSDQASQYQFGKVFYNTLRPEGYDANIKWEETQTYNAGIDFGLLNDRITGSVDGYFKKTKNLLNIIPVPAGSNLTNQILTNVGNIENKGIELTLNFRAVETRNLHWNLGLNATYNSNRITRLNKVKDTTYLGVLVGTLAGGIGNTIQIQSVGYAANSFFVLKQVYDADHHPIEGSYEDLNKDGIVNDRDKYHYRSPNPQWFLGFNTQCSYKKWTVSLAMRSNLGNYIYNNISSNNGSYRNMVSSTGYLANVSPSVLKTGFKNNQYFSDYYVENASFLRMDNVSVAYNVGRIINGKVPLSIAANVQNVFVITSYSGLDPEIVGGIDNNFYPRPRTYSFSVNLDF